MSHAANHDEARATDRSAMPTVLIVDDSVTIRRILGRALADSGYRIEEAGNGREALDQCRAEPPDLVLLDIDMPVMDGLSTLRAMKDDEQLKTELKSALSEQYDIRREIMTAEKNRIQDRLQKLERDLADYDNRREEQIEKQFKQLTSVPKSRPAAKTDESTRPRSTTGS